MGDFNFDFQSTLAGQWQPVSSSCVAAIRWLPPGRLEVRLRTGKVLPYAAPESALREMLAAPSKGRHLQVLRASYPYLG